MSAATNSIPRPFVIAALPELGILLNFGFEVFPELRACIASTSGAMAKSEI
jgi:hypothetical protein